jgi:hypothetical protein
MELSTEHYNDGSNKRRARILQGNNANGGNNTNTGDNTNSGNNNNTDGEATDDSEVVVTQPTFLTLSDIDETSLIDDWLTDILYSVVYDNDYVAQTQNYIFEDPVIILSIRKIIGHENKNSNSNTNTIFNRYRSNNEYTAYAKLGNEAVTRDITLDSGEVIPYVNPGSDSTIKDAGGYFIGIPRNFTEADATSNANS